MPRYFFSLRHRPGPAGLAVDEEGDCLADATAAREHALFVIRDTVARTRTDIVPELDEDEEDAGCDLPVGGAP